MNLILPTFVTAFALVRVFLASIRVHPVHMTFQRCKTFKLVRTETARNHLVFNCVLPRPLLNSIFQLLMHFLVSLELAFVVESRAAFFAAEAIDVQPEMASEVDSVEAGLLAHVAGEVQVPFDVHLDRLLREPNFAANVASHLHLRRFSLLFHPFLMAVLALDESFFHVIGSAGSDFVNENITDRAANRS